MTHSLARTGLTLIAALALPLAALALPVTEKITTSGRETGVIATIGDSVYAAGEELAITRAVTDDLYAAGGRVSIGSRVGGDLVVAGGEVSLGGDVAGDVRVAGGRVTVTGRVGGDLITAGGEVMVTSTAVIEGEVVGVGGRISFDGQTGRDLTLRGSDVSLAGQVAGQAELDARRLTVADAARVTGQLAYRAPSELAIPSTVATNVRYEPLTPQRGGMDTGNWLAAYVGFFLVSALITAVTGAVLIALSRRQTVSLAETARTQPGIAAIVGIGFFALPLVVIALLLSVVGVWLAVILLLVWLLLLLIAKVMTGFVIGQFLIRVDYRSSYLRLLGAFLLGLVIVTAVGLIPIVGWVLVFLASIFSVGVVTTSRAQLYNRLKHDKLV